MIMIMWVAPDNHDNLDDIDDLGDHRGADYDDQDGEGGI